MEKVLKCKGTYSSVTGIFAQIYEIWHHTNLDEVSTPDMVWDWDQDRAFGPRPHNAVSDSKCKQQQVALVCRSADTNLPRPGRIALPHAPACVPLTSSSLVPCGSAAAACSSAGKAWRQWREPLIQVNGDLKAKKCDWAEKWKAPKKTGVGAPVLARKLLVRNSTVGR